MLHMIYCDSRQMAVSEMDLTRDEITKGQMGELYNLNNVSQGKIVECLGIVDAGKGKTFPESHDCVKGGCRWAILVRTEK